MCIHVCMVSDKVPRGVRALCSCGWHGVSYVKIWIFMDTYIYIHIHTHIHVYICICMYIYIYICIYIYMYIYTYILLYTYRLGIKKSFCFALWRAKPKDFLIPNPKKTRAGPDGPNASGWYGRLRGMVSPLSVINSDQP